MALKLYHDAACTQEVTAQNSIETQHPIAGSTVTVQKYMKNDDATKYYTNATADPQGTDESYVQLSLDGTTFAAVGASVALADFGSAGTPDTDVRNLWVRVTTPSLADTQNRSNVTVNLAGREFAV